MYYGKRRWIHLEDALLMLTRCIVGYSFIVKRYQYSVNYDDTTRTGTFRVHSSTYDFTLGDNITLSRSTTGSWVIKTDSYLNLIIQFYEKEMSRIAKSSHGIRYFKNLFPDSPEGRFEKDKIIPRLNLLKELET